MNLFNTVSMIDIQIMKKVLYGGMLLYIFYIVIYYIIGRKELEKGVDVD